MAAYIVVASEATRLVPACSYGLHSYGLDSYGLHSYGLHRWGLYSHGIHRCGLRDKEVRPQHAAPDANNSYGLQ